ncbi:MAG: hypothetical protein N0E48_03455 [Candidatus Thiodiazotropha endolucinida]|nr:hypothetical protein [Candidatus Thiodiazotropha taylori]MCW4342418.1 hypothetical protein [Candidatus Thiodiazotropha endolucinida]
MVAIRLSQQEWQDFIDSGSFSIDPIDITINPTNTTVGQELPSAVSTTITATKEKECFESKMANAISILGTSMDKLDSNFQNFASAITQQVKGLTESVLSIQDQNEGMKYHIDCIEKDKLDIQKRLSSHDIFLQDINKILPPPSTPVSSMLPSFTGYFPTSPPPGIPRQPIFPDTSVLTNVVTMNGVKPNMQQSVIDAVSKIIPSSAVYNEGGRNVAVVTTTTNVCQEPVPTSMKQKVSTTSFSKSVSANADNEEVCIRGRSRHRKNRYTGSDTSLSPSPAPPKMERFSGDPSKLSWNAFIAKFSRTAIRRDWSEDKKLDRLFDCLTDKALEYANRSVNRDDYNELKKELALRFDMRDAPVAARQQLHVIKQSDEETLEDFLQRVLTITMDGYQKTDTDTVQQIATESFLRGCKYKEAAMVVMNESVSTIQDACRRVKTIMANKKAIGGGRVSFQERIFTIDEETRVSNIEKTLKEVVKTLHSTTGSPSRYGSPTQGQNSFRQRSPDYYRGNSPRQFYRGQSPTRPGAPYGGQSPIIQGTGMRYPNNPPYRDQSPTRQRTWDNFPYVPFNNPPYRDQSPTRPRTGDSYPYVPVNPNIDNPYRGRSPVRREMGGGYPYRGSYQQRSPNRDGRDRATEWYGLPAQMRGYPYMPDYPHLKQIIHQRVFRLLHPGLEMDL